MVNGAFAWAGRKKSPAIMDRSEEVIDNEVSHIVAEVRSGSEVKAEVDSGKYSAEGRLLGCGGEAAK